MASRVITQVVVAQPKESRRVFFHLKPDGDPSGSPGSSPGSSRGPSASPNGFLPCDKVVNVYMSVRIVRVLEYPLNVDGKTYLMISSAKNSQTLNDFRGVLDPAESAIYEKVFFGSKGNILIDTTSASARNDGAELKKKGAKLLLVRCENNSLHWTLESDLLAKPSTAGDRYLYQKARPAHAKPTTVGAKQEAMNKKQNYNFAREARTVEGIKAALKVCDNELPTCKKNLKVACEHEVKDPLVLREIHDYAVRVKPANKGRTWEEVCFDTKGAEDTNRKPSGPSGRSGRSGKRSGTRA